MIDTKFAAKVLGVFYEKYFENYVLGISHRGIETIVDAEKTEIIKTIKRLETEGMIWLGDWDYKITNYGIDTYEEALPPSAINNRLTQRKRILEFLNKHYEKDPDKNIEREQLVDELKIENTNELLSQMKYLEDNGLINIQLASGGMFWIKLSAAGSATFDTYDYDYSLPMTNAYKILFQLENRVRKFIEKKLINNFDNEWWKQGISLALRNKADDRKNDESSYGWTISVPKTDLDYLSFPDLGKIITNNWKDVFQQHFNDKSKIELKLKELEEIRNCVAHMRTLSTDGYTRLEQYNDDIINLIK